MLKATINADTFKEFIDAISALVSECRLHFEEDKLYTLAVDTANVAMVNMRLGKEAFNQFEATSGELGLDMAKVKNIFTMLGKAKEITLNLPEGSNKLEVSFEGYNYSITLLDVNTIKKDPNPPNIELPGKISIKGSNLNSAIKAAGIVSDKIWLGIDAEKNLFYMNAEGDTDNINRDFTVDELISTNNVSAKSLFSIDYLKEMGKVMNSADEVIIELGIDHPAKFAFDIAGGNGHVDYLLAPRIEAD